MEKTEIIKIRLTAEEKSEMVRRAETEGLTLSGLVRRQVMAEPITDAHAADLEAYRERSKQIAKVGNNLNQVARAINSGCSPSSEALRDIAQALRELQ